MSTPDFLRGAQLLWRAAWGLLRREPLRWRQLEPPGQVLPPAYAWDGGFDLVVSQGLLIPPAGNGITRVPCSLQLAQPEYCLLLVLPRSSTIQRGLLVTPTLIDQYRGEIFIFVTNTTARTQIIRAGERLAQVVPLLTLAEGLRLEQVERLPPSHRGDRGFGSTGGNGGKT